MDPDLEAQLRQGALCPHVTLQIKWVDHLQQLELYCGTCDNLLLYSAEDLRQIMQRNLLRRVAELSKGSNP